MNQPPTPVTELPAIGFLAEVSLEHRAFLACFGKFLRPQNGDMLIKEGEPQDSLYVIISGIQHIVYSVAGRQVLVAALGEGDSMGEINLFDPDKASATAITNGPGFVWSLSREELSGFLEADPIAGVCILRSLLRQVSKRMRSMNDKLASAEVRASFYNSWTSDAL
ncbi:MAG: cyclic nucleotide-binding domain-containing protein [Verrucomicrobia bacterium]|nr:cyclic nucleotide-binding domain-containing protein [Verrucomicrobiota bacterium]